MRRNTILASFSLFVVALVIIAIFQPAFFDRLWLWLVGFAGFIYAGFRKIGDLFGSNDKLEKIEASNGEIK